MSCDRFQRASLRRPSLHLALLSTLIAVCVTGALPAQASVSRPAGQPRPLGTLSLNGEKDPACPADFQCMGFDVDCPDVLGVASGFFAIDAPMGPPRGLVVFFSGTTGQGYWSGTSDLTLPFMDQLRQDGFEVVQVRWVDGWLVSSPGELAGPALLACRPATAVQWIHDNLYVPMEIDLDSGMCGFCLTGQSGGGDQATYPLAFYGQGGIVDAAVPTSSPTHAAMAQGCLQVPGLGYAPEEAQWIDDSYGYVGSLEGHGPCVNSDPTFTEMWQRDGLDTGGIDYVYDTTRVHLIEGLDDDSRAPQHAMAYYAKLLASGSPYLTFQPVEGMGHSITQSVDGLKALRETLLGND